MFCHFANIPRPEQRNLQITHKHKRLLVVKVSWPKRTKTNGYQRSLMGHLPHQKNRFILVCCFAESETTLPVSAEVFILTTHKAAWNNRFVKCAWMTETCGEGEGVRRNQCIWERRLRRSKCLRFCNSYTLLKVLCWDAPTDIGVSIDRPLRTH